MNSFSKPALALLVLAVSLFGPVACGASESAVAQNTASAVGAAKTAVTLSISTTALPAGIDRNVYLAQVEANGGTPGYTWSISSGSLPSGLTLVPATGLITGTPKQAGTSTFTLAVSDKGKPIQTVTKSFSITTLVPLAITTSALPSAVSTLAYTTTMQASGGMAPFTWSISSGSLPSGLTLDSSTGKIAGTPKVSGVSTFSVAVADHGTLVQNTSKILSISTLARLAITTSVLSSAVTGAAYAAPQQATGGVAPYTWSISAGNLPAGLTLDANTGSITGTPTASGISNFTETVTDQGNPVQSVSLISRISSIAQMTVPSTTLTAGTTGTAYAAMLSVNGGVPAYTWSITAGNLPAGLSLAATTGVISGTPNAAGTSNFAIKVSDNGSPTQTLSLRTSIKINAAATIAAISAGTTWYVRPDGGTRYSAAMQQGQCDGKGDAAYSGVGVNQHCAFNDYRFLWDDQSYGNSGWVIAGGDTVILRGGPWRVGFAQGTNPNDKWCFGGNGPFACMNPTVPAGTATQHTRILGENYASCGTSTTTDRSKLTQIYGGFAVSAALNLKGAQYVDVQCIDLSSHSQCSQHGLYQGNTFPGGCNTSFPLVDFGQNGVFTDTNTHDVLFQDVWIHGFPTRGVLGPVGGLITVNRTTLSYNGFTGWDFDDGNSTQSTNNATWKGSYVTIEYSGCVREYPQIHNTPTLACYDQSSGGQGDGIGTPPTALNFSCDHCDFHYNTQDGADFGHVFLSTGSFTNSIAYGNMGGTFKAGPNTSFTMTNNVSINNCQRMSVGIGDAPATSYQALTNFCRASGDGISFNFPVGVSATATLTYNTILGYGADTIDVQCFTAPGATSDPSLCPHTFVFKNNIVLGITEASYNQGQTPSMWNTYGPTSQSRNVFWGLRQNPTTSADMLLDPAFVGEYSGPIPAETVLDNFNFKLSAGSPAVGAAASVTGITTDYLGITRSPTTPSIGASEFVSN